MSTKRREELLKYPDVRFWSIKPVVANRELQVLKDVQAFLESRSFFNEAGDTSSLIDRVALLYTINRRQRTSLVLKTKLVSSMCGSYKIFYTSQ